MRGWIGTFTRASFRSLQQRLLAEALSGSTLSFEMTISAIASSEALDSSTEPVSSPDLEASSSTGGFVLVDFFPLSMKLSSEEALDSPKNDL